MTISVTVGEQNMDEHKPDRNEELKSWTKYIYYLLWKKTPFVSRVHHDDIVQTVLLDIWDKEFISAPFVRTSTIWAVDRVIRDPRNVNNNKCLEWAADEATSTKEAAKLELDVIKESLSDQQCMILDTIVGTSSYEEAAIDLGLTDRQFRHVRDKLFSYIQSLDT